MTSNKNFSLFLSFCLFIFAIIYRDANNFLFYTILIISLMSLLLAFLRPSILEPLNKGWHRLGESMGNLINPFILAIIFFGILTPVGVIRKFIFKSDPLSLKKDLSRVTYWKTTEQTRCRSESFKDQF